MDVCSVLHRSSAGWTQLMKTVVENSAMVSAKSSNDRSKFFFSVTSVSCGDLCIPADSVALKKMNCLFREVVVYSALTISGAMPCMY